MSLYFSFPSLFYVNFEIYSLVLNNNYVFPPFPNIKPTKFFWSATLLVLIYKASNLMSILLASIACVRIRTNLNYIIILSRWISSFNDIMQCATQRIRHGLTLWKLCVTTWELTPKRVKTLNHFATSVNKLYWKTYDSRIAVIISKWNSWSS